MEVLAEGDMPFAEAKTDVLRCEILAKRARARVFVASDGGSVEWRKASAESHKDVIEADDALVAATLAYERLRAERQRAEILIDVWRTIEASRRKS